MARHHEGIRGERQEGCQLVARENKRVKELHEQHAHFLWMLNWSLPKTPVRIEGVH